MMFLVSVRVTLQYIKRISYSSPDNLIPRDHDSKILIQGTAVQQFWDKNTENSILVPEISIVEFQN